MFCHGNGLRAKVNLMKSPIKIFTESVEKKFKGIIPEVALVKYDFNS